MRALSAMYATAPPLALGAGGRAHGGARAEGAPHSHRPRRIGATLLALLALAGVAASGARAQPHGTRQHAAHPGDRPLGARHAPRHSARHRLRHRAPRHSARHRLRHRAPRHRARHRLRHRAPRHRAPRHRAPPLTDRQLIGQHLLYPFEEDAPPSVLVSRIQSGLVAGVIVRTAQQGAELGATLAQLQSLPRPRPVDAPVIMAVDEEGGFNTEYPLLYSTAPADLGVIRDERQILRLIGAMSRNLLAAHMNVNLAPVVGVPRPGSFEAVMRRGFSADPREVARITRLWLRAAGGAGLVSTLKHFPGLGAGMANEDVQANRIDLPLAQLRAIDELPFATAAQDPRAMVMVSTGIYPPFGPLPALINPNVITGELRGRLGFQGVVVTDDVAAIALAPWGNPSQIAIRALNAGSDLLIISPQSQFFSLEADLLQALHTGALSRDALTRGLPRLNALRRRLVP